MHDQFRIYSTDPKDRRPLNDRKICIHFFFSLGLGLLVKAETPRPNVLFIFADDMSYETVGAHGFVDIDTPHLDTLAESGSSFTHAYNMGSWVGAVCVASRQMLNTGRFVWNARQTDLELLVADEASWSQRMSRAGYRTYMSGKWHLAMEVPAIFDVSSHIRPGMPNQTPEGYNRPQDRADYEAGWKPWERQYGGFWEGEKHWSEVLADDGVSFLERASEDDRPFFMYLAFNAPHDPRQAPKEYVDRYPLERIKLPENFLPEYPFAEAICGKQLRDERLIPYPRTEYAVKVNRQEYFALITHMDEQIGRILDALERTGQAENTYIVFTADHGLAVGRHGLVGKQNMYEHSVRVPFIVVGPKVPSGRRLETPIYLQDVMPTTLDLAGADSQAIDFKSLLPLLNGEARDHYGSIYGSYMGKQRMVIVNGWKLIAYPNIGVKRLYHLDEDPYEMSDLSAHPKYVGKLIQLTDELERRMDEFADPMSSLAAADYPVPQRNKQAEEEQKRIP